MQFASMAFFGLSGGFGLGAYDSKTKERRSLKNHRDLCLAEHFLPNQVPPEGAYGYFEGIIKTDNPLLIKLPNGFDYSVLASHVQEIETSRQKVTNVWSDGTKNEFWHETTRQKASSGIHFHGKPHFVINHSGAQSLIMSPSKLNVAESLLETLTFKTLAEEWHPILVSSQSPQVVINNNNNNNNNSHSSSRSRSRSPNQKVKLVETLYGEPTPQGVTKKYSGIKDGQKIVVVGRVVNGELVSDPNMYSVATRRQFTHLMEEQKKNAEYYSSEAKWLLVASVVSGICGLVSLKFA